MTTPFSKSLVAVPLMLKFPSKPCAPRRDESIEKVEDGPKEKQRGNKGKIQAREQRAKTSIKVGA